MLCALLWLMAVVTTSDAFVVRVVSPVQHPQIQQSHCLLYATVGIFFGTSVRIFSSKFPWILYSSLLTVHSLFFRADLIENRLGIHKTVLISYTKPC